ncbi:PEFG-CTERM sorting domain-containing protein [Marine Group I thaumarchaeote]|uniref:PEFG-CTERM sorting domain-containing protein n=1 Tax=Marine Group I thaumarchaeote TaxID=2511932 RepID=A0A7K4NEC3_9ARCH|nr:PEFG-CTERM sorting domain-containing protein [Marine Group I thaumarchaeote]
MLKSNSANLLLILTAVSLFLITSIVTVQAEMKNGDNLNLHYTVGDKVTLSFSPVLPVIHVDHQVVVAKDGNEIWSQTFHDHDGNLEIEITPTDSSSFSVTGGADIGGKTSTGAFMVSGPVFNEMGTYSVTGTITGIEFIPLPIPLADEFSIEIAGSEEMDMGGMEMKSMGEHQVSVISSDGSLIVNVDTSDPVAGEMMSVTVTITTDKKVHQTNANYDIIITQDGKTVLSETDVYTTHGEGEHMTDVLESSNPVDVQVTLQGIGKPGELKTGSMGEAISFHVVPEFGTIAMIVLAAAIVSIIVITAKTKTALIPKL